MGFLSNFVADYIVEIVVISGIFLLIMLISGFRIFEKAKIDGYKVLIPLYNLYLFVTIADLPIFVVALFFVPILNIFVFWFVSFRIGERFGKGIIFRIGMCILPFLFYLWLAFSSKCLYKAAEEIGHIRVQDQNSTLYNQFPDVEEVIEQPPIVPVPLEKDVYVSEGPDNGVPVILDDIAIPIVEAQAPLNSQQVGVAEPQITPVPQPTNVVAPQVTPVPQPTSVVAPQVGTPKVNALGIVEDMAQENLILDVDTETTWENKEQKSESELTKKVVTFDPINDDPLFNPDAIPMKASTLDQYKVCKHCRARLDLDAKICFLCGHRVDEDEE